MARQRTETGLACHAGGRTGESTSGASAGAGIALTLPQPVSANRYWRRVRLPGRTAVLVSREALAYKRAVAGLCVEHGLRPLAGELEMWLVLHPRMKADGQPSRTRMDLDNCIKVALDACQGAMYANDLQVVRLHAEIGHAMVGGGLTVRVEAA